MVKPVSTLMFILSSNCLLHFSGTVLWPPGFIFTEQAGATGIPAVVSCSSMMVFPLECISFCVPLWVHITPMKFMAVKSVPSIMCQFMFLQTIKD